MFLIKVGVDKTNYEYLCVKLQQLVYCQRNRKGVKMIEKAELKRIYNFATSKKKTTVSKAQNRNDEKIEWVVISDLNSSQIEIGITRNGYWGIKSRDCLSLLDKESSLLYFIVLLEYPMENIKRSLTASLEQFVEMPRLNHVFPFFEIVKFVFDYNSSTYWIELAFEWYDQFTFQEKQVLKESMDKLIINYSVSQKTRQKAKRELTKL